MKDTRRLAVLGLVTALALILSYVESLIPIFVGIPGVKLGLANLAVVFVLYRFCFRDALLVSVMRILISGFMFGNLMSISFSLAGGLLSLLVMYFMMKSYNFSVIGVSVAGGCMHNVGQLFVAAFVVGPKVILYYIPVLMLAGVLTGLLIGVGAQILIRRIPDL